MVFPRTPAIGADLIEVASSPHRPPHPSLPQTFRSLSGVRVRRRAGISRPAHRPPAAQGAWRRITFPRSAFFTFPARQPVGSHTQTDTRFLLRFLATAGAGSLRTPM